MGMRLDTIIDELIDQMAPCIYDHCFGDARAAAEVVLAPIINGVGIVGAGTIATDIAWMGTDDLRDELTRVSALLDKAVDALKSLCDKDAGYCGNTILILCDSHSEAIQRMRLARAVIAAADTQP